MKEVIKFIPSPSCIIHIIHLLDENHYKINYIDDDVEITVDWIKPEQWEKIITYLHEINYNGDLIMESDFWTTLHYTFKNGNYVQNDIKILFYDEIGG